MAQKHRSAKTATKTIKAPVTQPCNLYISSAVEGDMAQLLGAPHYSYRFAESKFAATLDGRTVAHKLQMPEFYNTPAALPDEMHDRSLPSVHLIFRSSEQIRLLKFAWNISCFAWEFDVLKDSTEIDEHPFLNQKRMLSLCDEIWVPCAYSKTVLEAHGLANVHFIPAAIALPPVGRTTSARELRSLKKIVVAPLSFGFLRSRQQNRAACEEKATSLGQFLQSRRELHRNTAIYLTVLNPEDYRKNLDAMLRAFHCFSAEHPEAVLLVKVLTSASRFDLLNVLSDVIPHKLDSGSVFESDNIVFFNDFLSEEAMGTLYSLAKYYLCATLCEGQNLPLLEAMSYGAVPVTTAHTAMLDYVTQKNSIIIADRIELNDCVHLAGTIARKPFMVRRARTNDIHQALRKSAALSATRHAAMSKNARQAVVEKYAPEAVWPLIRQRLQAIARSIDRDGRRGAAR